MTGSIFLFPIDAEVLVSIENDSIIDLHKTTKNIESKYFDFENNIYDSFYKDLKYIYNYSEEEIIKKIIPCFEDNISDVPFDSKLYHCDEFQEILAKADALRIYGEKKNYLPSVKK